MAINKLLLTASLLLVSAPSWGQVTPSELADLSMQELLGMNISENDLSKNPWSVSFSHRQLQLNGFRRGTSNVADSDLLAPPPAVNTNQQFPILPNNIEQKINTLSVGYQLSPQMNLSLAIPNVEQSTDHISSISNFDAFTIKSDGLGDVALSLQYQLSSSGEHHWFINAGLSFPTGSIDQMGDTPKPGESNPLPYTMQLGSGTYDIPASVNYSTHSEQLQFGAQASLRLRTGKNDKGYRLGNHYIINTWARYNTESWFHPSIKLTYQHTDRIHGADSRLTGPGGSFPAPITNPNNFGGDKINLALGLRIGEGINSSKPFVDLEISQPIYQNLNGVQVQEDWQFGISIGYKF